MVVTSFVLVADKRRVTARRPTSVGRVAICQNPIVNAGTHHNVIKVGVIGAGMMGEVHARTLTDSVPGVLVTAVHDTYPGRAAAVAAAVGAEAFDDVEALLDVVDAVVIASPDEAHAEQTLAALARGLHVLCEKPLATSADAARSIVDAETAIGRRLVQVGLMREFDPGHAEIAEAARAGTLGDVVVTRSVHLNPRPWVFPMPAERAITQSMIHDIHSVRFLSGAEVDYADVDSVADPATGSIRYVAARLGMSDGSLGLIDLNVGSGYGYRVDAEVIGTAATMATVDPATTTTWRAGSVSSAVPDNWPDRFVLTYRDELVAWVASIRSGRPVGASAWDGYMANVVADACVRSEREGRRVAIERPDRADLYRR